AGVTLRQNIPRGSLPVAEPATLHMRIAQPVPSGAHFSIVVDNRVLFDSEQSAAPERPVITLSLPSWLLEKNAHESLEIELRSHGSYDPFSFLLFPVIPRPWASSAHRDGSVDLSPTTGIASGSLDWWTHRGFP